MDLHLVLSIYPLSSPLSPPTVVLSSSHTVSILTSCSRFSLTPSFLHVTLMHHFKHSLTIHLFHVSKPMQYIPLYMSYHIRSYTTVSSNTFIRQYIPPNDSTCMSEVLHLQCHQPWLVSLKLRPCLTTSTTQQAIAHCHGVDYIEL